MIFIKYILLNLLFLFGNNVSIINFGFLSILSLSMAFIVEIKKDYIVNILISLLYCMLIYFVRDSIYFIFPVLYAIYKVDYKNLPIFLIFLYPLRVEFLVLSLLIVFIASMEKSFLRLEKEKEDEFLDFHKTKFALKKNLKQLHFEEERKERELISKEREQISQKLHNSIGHTLSATILELHALSLVTEEEDTRNSLEHLRENLTKGMVEIREIIHNMHKSAFDLQNSIEKILKETEINTNFIYNVENECSTNLSYDILNIVKEAVTNCIKYSNGNNFSVRLIENENLYILTIWDDGTDIEIKKGGLGLLSIKEISEKYFGSFNVITDDGFKINVTFSKE